MDKPPDKTGPPSVHRLILNKCAGDSTVMGKKGDVLPFPAMRGLPANGFRKSDVMAEKSALLARSECLALLGTVAPVPEALSELLGLPAGGLFRVDSGPTLSTDPAVGAKAAKLYLNFGKALTADMPYYAISIHRQGESLFCTLVDRKRRVIVQDAIGSMYGGANWESFQRFLEEALKAVDAGINAGEAFDFVVRKEGVLRTVQL